MMAVEGLSMSEIVIDRDDRESVSVRLGDPRLAALLAWLWPGAGHFYQRRFTKGFVFMIAILSTYIYGMWLGGGRVVYASFHKDDFRWQFVGQMGLAGPNSLAIVQKIKTNKGGDPFFVLAERYPEQYRDPNGELREFERIPADERDGVKDPTLKDGLMAPPAGPSYREENDVLGMWHAEYKQRYDMGTLYTLVAGLLNILVIYDAFDGPVVMPVKRRRRRDEPT